MGPFLVMSAFATKIVDLLRNTFDKDGTAPKWAWQVAAFVVGIGLAIAYQQTDVSQVTGLPPFLANQTGVGAEIVVGLAIGAGASGFHELFDALSGVAKRGHAAAKKNPVA